MGAPHQLLGILLVSLWSACATADPLFVTNEYEPYVITSSPELGGIFPDIIRAIADHQDSQPTINVYPWKRGEQMLTAGQAFAAFPYIQTPERNQKHKFSDPVICFYPKFYYLKSRFPNGFSWNTLDDLKEYHIGGVIGYWYEERFRKNALSVDYVHNDKQSIRMLMRGRTDLTLIEELVGWALIKTTYPKKIDQFAVAQKPERKSAFHLMISRKYPQAKKLTQQFNQGLKAIKRNGTYQRILKKYQVPKQYQAVTDC